MKKTEQQKWEERVYYALDGCWYYIGTLNEKGYGRYCQEYAHRRSYRINKGEIPKGLFVCHNCDNPACVNPDHLFLGTHQDNMDDMVKKGRHRDVRGENNFRAKLTNEDVLLIRELYPKSSLRKLAKQFNCGGTAIFNIVHKLHWKHI